MNRSWAQYIAEVVLVDKLSKPMPVGLPPMGALLGAFPDIYLGDGPAAEAHRREALGALLQRRGVAGPEGAAFMPCIVAPLGAKAPDCETAAARVLHVLQGGLQRGLWAKLPAAGHAQQATGSTAADMASISSLTVRSQRSALCCQVFCLKALTCKADSGSCGPCSRPNDRC